RDHSFRIEVPGEDSVVAERGEFRGLLDGTPCLGPRFLAAGSHTLVPVASGNYADVWQRAVAGGVSPWPCPPNVTPSAPARPARHVSAPRYGWSRGAFRRGGRGAS